MGRKYICKLRTLQLCQACCHCICYYLIAIGLCGFTTRFGFLMHVNISAFSIGQGHRLQEYIGWKDIRGICMCLGKIPCEIFHSAQVLWSINFEALIVHKLRIMGRFVATKLHDSDLHRTAHLGLTNTFAFFAISAFLKQCRLSVLRGTRGIHAWLVICRPRDASACLRCII